MIPASPNVLIVKLSAIGDVVHTLPAVNAIRHYRPQAHITWLVEEAAAGLVINHPAVDRVLVSSRKRWANGLRTGAWRKHLSVTKRFAGELRDTRYDLVIDFQSAIKGAMLIALTRARRKIGFGPGLEHQECSYMVLNERIPAVSMEIHALKRSLMLVEAIGIPVSSVAYNLPISAEITDRTTRLLQDSAHEQSAPAIAINPVAKWETKLWPSDRFAHLADALIERYGANIYFTGSKTDAHIIQSIMQSMQHRAVNLAGATALLELAIC